MSDPHGEATTGASGESVRHARFLNVHSILTLLSVAASILWSDVRPLVAEGLCMFGWLLIHRAVRCQAKWVLGVANWITLLRLALVLTAGIVLLWSPPLIIFLLFSGNVILDNVDGAVARKCGESSTFGSLFDAEVDAWYIVTAVLYYDLALDFGAWVLLAGLLRYVFRLAVWTTAGNSYAERPRQYAQRLGGIVFVMFAAAVILPVDFQFGVVAAATVISAVSFGISFVELARYVRSHTPR